MAKKAASLKPMGRPSKYKDDFCEQLIKHMSEGFSFESFGGKISVNQDTLYAWARTHQEFSDAKKEAFEKSRLFWETIGIKGAQGKIPFFNVTAWIFNMKNRFGWRDQLQLSSDDERGDRKIVLAYELKPKDAQQLNP